MGGVSVNYLSGRPLANWNDNNPAAFNQENVSQTLKEHICDPTPLKHERH